MKPTKIATANLSNYTGRPVWYQSRSRSRDFGWALVKNVDSWGGITVVQASSGERWIALDSVDLYESPAIKSLCSRCRNYVRATPGADPAHCMIHSAGQYRDCSARNLYRDFEPENEAEKISKNTIVKDYIRALKLAGWWQLEVAK